MGFRNYLFIFSIFKVYTLKRDQGEKDFFHFLDLLNQDDDALDIGANIGIMSTHLAKRIGQSTLHAFEPVPDNIHALERITKFFKLKNLKLYKVALGHEKGEIEMVMPEIDAVKKQGLSHVVHEDITEFNEGEKFTVPVLVLDDIEDLHTKNIQAIKIDVENFEYYVFKGAQNLIKKNKPIIYCELWDNENRYKCFDLLTSLSYQILVLEGSVLVPYNKEAHTTQNFFFLPAIQ